MARIPLAVSRGAPKGRPLLTPEMCLLAAALVAMAAVGGAVPATSLQETEVPSGGPNANPPAGSTPLPGTPPTTRIGLGPLPAPGTVTLVQVNVTAAFNPIEGPTGAAPADPIRLPHCSLAQFNGSSVWLLPQVYDAGARVVVMVAYTDRSSFSGGGDDVDTIVLKEGESAPVRAAFSGGTVLYDVNAEGTVYLTLRDAVGSQDQVKVTYAASGVGEVAPRPAAGAGNYTITETHSFRVHPGLPLVEINPWFCR